MTARSFSHNGLEMDDLTDARSFFWDALEMDYLAMGKLLLQGSPLLENQRGGHHTI